VWAVALAGFACPERVIGRMTRPASPGGIEAQLAELERQHSEGTITEITFTVRKNLLIARTQQSTRRRALAMRLTPPPPRPRWASPPAVDPPRRRPRVSRRGAAWLLGVAVAAGLVLGMVHLSGSSAPAASASQGAVVPSSHPTATGSPPGAPAASGGSTTTIGETKAVAGGGSVTLLGYTDHFSSSSPINNPLPPGGFYAAVELKVCAGAAASIVSPFEFTLVDPNQAQVGIASGPTLGKQPQLSLAQLPPDGCVTGWLSYGVTVRPVALDDSADSLTFSIPS